VLADNKLWNLYDLSFPQQCCWEVVLYCWVSRFWCLKGLQCLQNVRNCLSYGIVTTQKTWIFNNITLRQLKISEIASYYHSEFWDPCNSEVCTASKCVFLLVRNYKLWIQYYLVAQYSCKISWNMIGCIQDYYWAIYTSANRHFKIPWNTLPL